MRRFIAWQVLGTVVAISCGGRTSGPDVDGGGGTAGNGNAGGATVGTTTGAVGTTTGTVGTTVGAGGTTTGTGGTGARGGTGGSGGAGATDPGADWSACTGPAQCMLAMTKCCACGVLGLDQLAAINSSQRDAFSSQVCGAFPQPCPPCVGAPDAHLMARCESGRCRGFDIRTDPTYTKCGGDQDCTLRNGLGCCECGAPTSWADWVAISHVGKMLLGNEVCAPGSSCPKCIPVPPPGTIAACVNGACTRLITATSSPATP